MRWSPLAGACNRTEVLSSQKVGNDLADGSGTGRLSCSIESREVPVQGLIDVENRRNVATPIAVVWS